MTYLLPKLAFRSFIGFDDFLNEMEKCREQTTQNYPPYNIKKIDEDNYIIEMSVAGFTENDITTTLENKKLIVEAKKEKEKSDKIDFSKFRINENTIKEAEAKMHLYGTNENGFLYKGLAERSFKQSFRLQEYVEVEKAELKYGILSIFLKRNLPEAQKPRKITIENIK